MCIQMRFNALNIMQQIHPNCICGRPGSSSHAIVHCWSTACLGRAMFVDKSAVCAKLICTLRLDEIAGAQLRQKECNVKIERDPQVVD